LSGTNSDADHAVIDRYGLPNEDAAQKGRFLPHPPSDPPTYQFLTIP
jgi:hypothetical protein